MNYEEKYKEALERARNLHKDAIDMDENIRAKQCEIIFPELAESEDERIRKDIIYFLSRNTFQFGEDIDKYKSWIAWLEKQGKKESDPRYKDLEELLAADNIYQMAMNDAMIQEAKEKAVNALSGMCIGRLLGFEKQGENKPEEWSEEDEKNLFRALLLVQKKIESYKISGLTNDGLQQCENWLKSLKERITK